MKIGFKRDLKLIFISMLIALELLLFILAYMSFVNKTRDFLNEAKDQIVNEYNLSISIYKEMTSAIFDLGINKGRVLSIFYNGVTAETPDEMDKYRKELYEELLPLYNKLQEHNFRQLHFHTSKNISFLRFHAPEKYGDDLTGIRYSVEYVNKARESICGFEEGRIYSGYRFVFPVNYANHYVGSVEISTSPYAILSQLTQRFSLPGEFIIKKSVVTSKVFESELDKNYIEWNIDSNFVIDKDVALHGAERLEYPEDIKKQINLKFQDEAESADASFIASKESQLILFFVPILNFEGDIVAYYITSRSFLEIREYKTLFKVIKGVFTILVIVSIFFFLYYIRSQKRILQLANNDHLTGVYVRRVLLEEIDKEIARFNRYGTPFSIIMIDLDKFKKINDDYGHRAGDTVLKRVTQAIRENLRELDLVGRYGGEEFIIVLPETNLDSAYKVADNIRKKICELAILDIPGVSISCGVEEFSQEMGDSNNLINRADVKLYKAKTEGRNRVIY